jgi:A/G-specific adenine glycosylase
MILFSSFFLFRTMDKTHFFRHHLLEWFGRNHRPLPWKGERDPYRIWLSEIILQQTRVEQGLPYYLKFVAAFPTVSDLAAAAEDAVFKLWEGLGYYSRARNLHATARYIAYERHGVFPDTFEGLRALKGVGDYTAAALASFAFGLPHAVVDGNVYRVLARFFGIDRPTDAPAVRREIAALAQELLDPARPADFNQAIMDFGATHCTPQLPKCPSCPLQPQCTAFAQGRVAELPVRGKATAKRQRYFLYAVFSQGSDVFVQKRLARDIWQNLYEFPMLELPGPAASGAEAARALTDFFFPGGTPSGLEVKQVSAHYRQQLSHQTVIAQFIDFSIPEPLNVSALENLPFEKWQRVARYDVKKNMAFPRIIDRFLQENVLTLSLF